MSEKLYSRLEELCTSRIPSRLIVEYMRSRGHRSLISACLDLIADLLDRLHAAVSSGRDDEIIRIVKEIFLG